MIKLDLHFIKFFTLIKQKIFFIIKIQLSILTIHFYFSILTFLINYIFLLNFKIFLHVIYFILFINFLI